MKAYIYCTKAKPYLYKTEDTTYPAYPIGYHTDRDLKLKLSNTNELAYLNGKIVSCFDLNKVEEINYRKLNICDTNYSILLEKSCLTDKQIYNYLTDEKGYAWHIDNLQVFDRPMELSDFEIEKAPQSWQFVRNIDNELCILISIKPEWVEKILNGEKIIEVRKTCPKSLKG